MQPEKPKKRDNFGNFFSNPGIFPGLLGPSDRRALDVSNERTDQDCVSCNRALQFWARTNLLERKMQKRKCNFATAVVADSWAFSGADAADKLNRGLST